MKSAVFTIIQQLSLKQGSYLGVPYGNSSTYMIDQAMEMCPSYFYLIHILIILFALASRIPMGCVKTGGYLTYAAAENESNSSNTTSPNKIINVCGSHLLNIASGSTRTITLQSRNERNPCSIFLVGPPGQWMLFAFDENDSTAFQYLYVERPGLQIAHKCHQKFVAFTENPSHCNVSFSYDRVWLHLKGRTTLQLKTFISNGSSHHDLSQSNLLCSQELKTCGSMQYYDHVSHCTTGQYELLTLNQVKNITQCYFYCSPGCTCVLSKNTLAATCSNQKTSTTYVVYSNNPIGLHLGNKRIHTLSKDAFTGLETLLELCLSNNSLTHVASGVFGHLRYLNWLDMSSNQLTNLQPHQFHGLSSLDFLNLGYNKLSNLQSRMFRELRSLDGLFLHNNHFVKLNAGVFHGLGSLKWLNLENNRLTGLKPEILEDLTTLQTIKLGNNSFSHFQSNMLLGLNRLNLLELQNNQLEELRSHSFNSVNSLAFLDLNGNHLTKIHKDAFQELDHLLSLSLTNNHLTNLEPGLFSPLTRLTWLNLDSNKLTDITPGTFAGLSSAQILLLQHNKITVLRSGAFQGIQTIRHLNMSNNNLYDIHIGAFQGLKNLERMFLNSNNLTALGLGVLDGLVKLERLYLVKNKIRNFEPGIFDGLISLQILYLEGNNIKDISTGVFNGLPKLNIIQLTNNYLSILSTGVFHDVDMLHYLNLENNSLQRLEENFCNDCNSLETLNLIGNTLHWVRTASFSGLSNSTQVLVDDHATCCFSEISKCTAQNQKPVFLTCERLLPKPILRICMWILGVCAMCGNAFVLYCRFSKIGRDRDKVQSQLIIHLSFSDLLMGVYMIILTSADVHFGEYFPSHANTWREGPTCQLASVLSILSSEASVFFVTLISIDRLLGVKYPFSSVRLNHKSTRIVTTVLWVTALILSTMPLLLTRISPDFYDVSEVCIGLPMARKSVTKSKNMSVLLSRYYTKRIQVEVMENLGTKPGMYYSIAIFIGLNLLCFVIVAFCYVQIFVTVRRSSQKAGRRREREEEIRMASKMAVIVATDFCCWMPVIITGILVQGGVIEISPVMYAWVVTFILPINSSVNPFMYTLATAVSDRVQRKTFKRGGSVMNTFMAQRTIQMSAKSGHVQGGYKDLSSQIPTDENNRTSETASTSLTTNLVHTSQDC